MRLCESGQTLQGHLIEAVAAIQTAPTSIETQSNGQPIIIVENLDELNRTVNGKAKELGNHVKDCEVCELE